MSVRERASTFSRLAGIDDLPSLPHVTSELLRRLNHPDSNVKDVTQILSEDPSLAGHMLRMVNSAYYGVRQEVTSLNQAIAFLGYRTVRSVVLASAAKGLFRLRCKSSCFDQQQFTLHGVAAAAVARHIARIGGVLDPELAFSVGLLHDVRKLALDQVAPDQYTAVFTLARQAGVNFLMAEQSIEGLGHCEAGARLVESWELPADIVDGIWHHHSMSSAANPQLAATLLVTNYICELKGFGAPHNFAEGGLNRRAWECLHIPLNALAHVLRNIEQHITPIRDMFDL